jgi:hypothetical protein
VNRTGFSQRLELRQSQTLVMTPQLQQAIKMLQLSNLELTNFIDGFWSGTSAASAKLCRQAMPAPRKDPRREICLNG